jgi:hypothetical protein
VARTLAGRQPPGQAHSQSSARFVCRTRSRPEREGPPGPSRRLRLRGRVAFSYCNIRRAHSGVLHRHSIALKSTISKHLRVRPPPMNKILRCSSESEFFAENSAPRHSFVIRPSHALRS